MGGHTLYVIGRSDACDITINDGTVSRMHCELVRSSSGGILISDRASAGGTYVARGGEWHTVTQTEVSGGEILLLGRYQTTASQLLAMVGQAQPAGAGTGPGPEATTDRRPDGPVKRDPVTGQVVSN